MNKKLVFLLTAFVFMALAGRVQAQESRFLENTASLSGNTGLWKLHTPQNLPPGQASFSVWADRINRNPGQLTITTYGFGGSVGLTNWLEFGANFEVNRRVLVRRSDQLSLGQRQLGLFGAQVPGALPSPGELMPGSTLFPQLRSPATSTGSLTGAAGYYNALPFANRIQGNGVGTVAVGLKFGLLSEDRGNAMGLGVRTYAHIPTHRSIEFLMFRPTQTGGWIWGSDILLGKRIGELADLSFNVGYRGYESPDDGRPVVLSNSMPLGIGVTLPRGARFQLMSELTSEVLVGDRTPNTVPGADDVIDWTLGMRAFVTRYVNLSAGYRRPLNQFGGDKNGFVFQLGFTYGPPYEEALPSPPSLSCSADPVEVQAGQAIRLTAQGTPSTTGGTLSYQWNTNAGTIQGSGETVQLNTTGLAPGQYIATVRVTEQPVRPRRDGQVLFADCSVRFNIAAPPAPQPPTVDLSADRNQVQVGEAVNFTARGNSPDNRPLTYTWTTTAGSLQPSQTTARLDTAAAQPGQLTVTVRATDDRGLSAEASQTITLTAPPPPPPPAQVQLLDQCQFTQNSSRVDNVCKARLDSIALRLQSEPDATLTIVGFAATNENNQQQLAQTRADNVRAYLATEKGIAQGRLTSRTGTPGAGAQSRRVEMHLVPRGATFQGYDLRLEQERLAQAPAQQAPASTEPAGRRTVIATLR